MATPQQILEALRRADAAGNTEDAKRIANLYKNVTQLTDPNQPKI